MRRALHGTASLEGFYKHFGLADCLIFIGRELGRLNASEEDLLEYQSQLLRDLRYPLDEDALSEMHNYWEYDLALLAERRRTPYGPQDVPAKPRIDVDVEITSKGNLKAEWFPRGWNRWGPPLADNIASDFIYWDRFENRRISYDSRPSNELFFLRGVGHAIDSLCAEREGWSHPFRSLNHVLLAACADVVDTLESRLETHFDVRMRTDVFVEWSEPPEDRDWRATPPTISKWEIDSPAKRQREAELAEIANMEEHFGFTLEGLFEAWAIEATGKKGTGPAPSPHTLGERIARTMKRSGHKATKGNVERAMTLLWRHQPAEVSERCGERSES